MHVQNVCVAEVRGVSMQKPDHVSDKRWQQHLAWMQVTGETKNRHIRELAEKRKQQEKR